MLRLIIHIYTDLFQDQQVGTLCRPGALQIWRTLEHETILIEHALPSKYIAHHSVKNPLLDMLAMYLATLTALTIVLIRMQDQSHGA